MILLLMFVIGQVQTAAMQPSVDSVLRQMSSATLADRERGIASLKVLISANPSVSSDPKVQRAVASALARDNELIQQNLSAVANKQQSVISEDFAEHYSELLDVALELLDAPMTPDAKSRLIEEMVRSTYNPDSDVGRPPLLAERSVRRLAAEAAKTLRSMR